MTAQSIFTEEHMTCGSVLMGPVFLYHSFSLLSAFAHKLNFQF